MSEREQLPSLDELLAATERVDRELLAERRRLTTQDSDDYPDMTDDMEFAEVVVTESGEVTLRHI